MRTPVVVAFTPNYFIPAAVTIQSLLSSSSDNDCFTLICLLSEDLPDWQKEELEKLGDGRIEYRFLNLKGKLGCVYVDQRYTEAASYRLLLPTLLPEYDKTIYIDCDIVVRQNLARLISEVELGDNYLAGVFEATLDFQLPHLNAIGCKAGQYINSGVLVMNLNLMRQHGMVEKLLDGLKVDYLEFPDQDVLNMVCKGRILGLPPIYNGIRTFFLPQYKNDFLKYYSEDDWNAVHKRGTIHYTGGKPWNIFSVMFKEWWNEYDKLPESIKRRMPINNRLFRLYKLYSVRPLGWILDTAITIKRRIKK